MRRWLVRMLAVGSALACWTACGSEERPPLAEDLPPPPPPEGSLVDPAEPLEPNLTSPCGAATVALDFIRPNLYFAIDASGSMLDEIPRGAGSIPGAVIPSHRYGTLSVALERLLRRVGHRVNYGATLFPSADVACDAGEEVLPLTTGDTVSFAVSGELGPVLRELMFSINRRTPRGGTPIAAALTGLVPKLEGHGGDTYVFLVTDGGPNCGSAACGPETCIPNLERVQLSSELFCGGDLNCCDPSAFGVENCLDDGGAEAAVAALSAIGVRTFVIGIPGSEIYSDVLDRLARLGGVPRAGSPSYYRASDAEELMSTVGRLGLELALGCQIPLAEAPPDPSLVNLFFDGELIPADPVDGWAFEDARTVRVLGAACALLEAGQVLQADVVAGCPVVVR